MAKYKLPPRQQMINLLYIILIAMLAINISSETLDAYSLLNDDSMKKIEKLRNHNRNLSDSIARIHPEQKQALGRIGNMSDAMLLRLEKLQREIVRKADDVQEGEPGLIPEKKEDLNAVPYTMLSVASQEARHLKEELAALRDSLCRLTGNKQTQDLVAAWLTMDKRGFATTWEKGTFSNMSAIGGITYLNILKENVLLACAETMKGLDCQHSGITTTADQETANDSLSIGDFILVNNRQVKVQEQGTLEQPVVHLESKWDSQIYADYRNVMDLTTIGSNANDLSLTAQGGQVTRKGTQCIIIPNKGAQSVVVSVMHRQNGTSRPIARKTFSVRPLPTPEPYLLYEENKVKKRYRGNTPMNRETLTGIKRIGAFIGTPVNEEARISGSEVILVKNNSSQVLSAKSNSEALSGEQINILRKAEKGDKVYFTSIKARGHNGAENNLASISIIVY